jgi:beta-fructofuranosidase
MAVGAGIKRVGGAVLLYRSADLNRWEYLGPLLADEGGLPSKVWECPAFFPLGDRHVLIVSVTSRAYVLYFIGRFDGRTFQPEVCRRLDYGRYFFAPQTLLDDAGRRVMIGWVWEGRSEEKDIEAGWSGIQSVPRVLTLGADDHLTIEPVRELQKLRRDHRQFTDLALAAGVPRVTGVRGNQLEIVLRWQPDAAREMGLILAQSPGGEEQTQIIFDRAAGELSIDRRRSNARGDVDLDTQFAPLSLAEGEALKLHIFYDRSVIEIFANDRVCLTSRIYPTRDDTLGLSLFANGADTRLSSMDIWQIDSIW